jgi:GMP synthase-like glutamine amidotransferase
VACFPALQLSLALSFFGVIAYHTAPLAFSLTRHYLTSLNWTPRPTSPPQTQTPRHQTQHRDHLPQVPPNFELLGSSPKCKVQGIVQYYPEDSSAEETKGSRNGNGRGKIRIVGLQGHPEFTTVSNRIASVFGAYACGVTSLT